MQLRMQMDAMNNNMAQQNNLIAQLWLDLNAAVERADRAQQTTADLAKVSAAAVGRWDGGLVDGRAVGQPFKYTGNADQDLPEWVSKFTDFV